MQGTSRYNWQPDRNHRREQVACRLMVAAGCMFQTEDGKPDDQAWERHLMKQREYKKWRDGR